MPENTADPWSGATYNGFSGVAATPPPTEARPAAAAPPVRRGRPSTRNLMLGGVAGAVALGLVFGIWARPNMGAAPSSKAAAADKPLNALPPGAADAAAAGQVKIEVDPRLAATQPPAPGKIQVLSPGAAPAPAPVAVHDAAPAAAPAAAPRPRVVASTGRPVLPQVRYVTPPPAVSPRPLAVPPPNARSGDDGDAGLAAADRRMRRAYDRALAAGVPARDLQAEQEDFDAIRQDAARHSRDAAASVTQQRTDELNEMADDAQQ